MDVQVSEWRPGYGASSTVHLNGALTAGCELDRPALAASHRLELLCESDQLVPAAASDRSEVPGSSRWLAFGVPTPLGNALGWLATVKSDKGEFDGIFAGEPTAPRLLIRTCCRSKFGRVQSLAPTEFVGFTEPAFGSPDVFSVIARTRNANGEEQTGLWFHDAGGVRQILRINGPAPGVPGARLTHVESHVVTAEADLFVTGQMRQDGFDRLVRTLWLWSAKRGWRLLLCEGATLPSAQGQVIDTFTALRTSFDSPDVRRFDPKLGILPVSVRWKSGGLAILTVSGDGATTVHWQSEPNRKALVANWLPIPDVLPNREGIVARVVTAQSGAKQIERVIVARNHQTEMLAESGGIAPGTGDRTFKSFCEPVVNEHEGSGSIALVACLQPVHESSPQPPERGIWWRTSATGSALALVVRTGDPAPGCEGLRFVDFRSIAMLPQVGPVFCAKMGRIGRARDDHKVGLWMAQPTGSPVLILKTGDLLPGNGGGEPRIIKDVDVVRVSSTPGQGGDSTPCDTYLAIRVSFSRGGTAILRVCISRTPTAGSLNETAEPELAS